MGAATIPTIPPGQLIARMSGGSDVDLIDVRTPAEYDNVHAAGATLAPLDRLDCAAVASSRRAGESGPIYLICKSGSRATSAARKFIDAGHTDVCVVEGGTDAWLAAGGPVTRGTSKVISIDRQVRITLGILLLIGTALAVWVHPWFWLWPAFLGAGNVFAGVTDFCGMALILARAPEVRRGRELPRAA